MHSLEDTWAREAKAIERGFTPRTENSCGDMPAQSAGCSILGAINFVPASLPRSLDEDAELWHRNRTSEASEFMKQISEATWPGKESSSLRSSLPVALKPSLPDFHIELLPGGQLPTKANPSDAGWDCYSLEDVTIRPGAYAKVRLGFKLQIPEGWEVQLRGRSGLAINQGIISHFGTIDHLYRQELQAILTLLRDPSASEEYSYYNLGKGDKVCQMVFAPVYANRLIEIEKVVETGRGGFGSTGR